MITHTLHIGERVFDDYDRRWGYVALIGNQKEDCKINDEMEDAVVLLVDEPLDKEYWNSEWETFAENCYQVSDKGTFFGNTVCVEHHRDEMSTDYPLYCPDRDENLFEFELD